MRVLHLIGGDLSGGAARGAYWLHQGLKNLGVDSRILTNSKPIIDDENIIYILESKKDKLVNILRAQLDNLPTRFYRNRKKVVFSTGIAGFDFTRTKDYKESDILHLHWINAGFVNIKHLSKVDKPVVWTMRDMWPMTGGCHYALHCENYKSGCGCCEQIGSKSSPDLSRWVLNRKVKYIPKNIKIVGISYWLSEIAKESAIFREFDIRTIHNNVNTDEFFPIDKEMARTILGIKTDKKIILACAQDLEVFYKGFDKFLEALKRLNRDKYFSAFLGRLDEQSIKDFGFEYKNFGFLYDNVSLRLAYSASDVVVAPSVMDAFGKTLAESMACGTPVVCFDATGPRDIVDHKQNGYLAQPFDPEDLARGIHWVLDDEHRLRELARNARQKVEEFFDIRVVARRYKELYDGVLKKDVAGCGSD